MTSWREVVYLILAGGMLLVGELHGASRERASWIEFTKDVEQLKAELHKLDDDAWRRNEDAREYYQGRE